MDNINYEFLEKDFVDTYRNAFGNYDSEITFYVPTKEHSSGFEQVEIQKHEGDKYYEVTPELSEHLDAASFKDITNKYPLITLSREYAFYNKFTSWEDIYLACRGKKVVDLCCL